jgi:hypothetical protein
VTAAILAVLALGAFASLPYWLPNAVVSLRTRIFTAINGDEGIAIPGELVPASRFKHVYSQPAAHGRSRGARLSDLFWYWLSPGAELHQEHLEPGPRYDEVAKATRRVLALPKYDAAQLAERAVARLVGTEGASGARLVRLRALLMPIWAEFYYELVFRKPCPPEARALIVDNAEDVVSALKCCSLRHLDRRNRLTRYLVEQLEADAVPHPLPEHLSLDERALYLQGVFFNTAVVQMSEAMTHVLLAIAQHEPIQRRLVETPEDPDYLERVITEVLRVYPLFGISHRITSAAIDVGGAVLPAGSVLCFNHAAFHRHGFLDAERIDPERWRNLSPKESSYIPFGVTANRPCPAQAIALIGLRVATRELLKRFRFASSVRHTRSIPNAGPCLLIPRRAAPHPRREALALQLMRFRDRWEDVLRSLIQLVLGSYMVWHARRLRLCERYFTQTSPGSSSRRARST